MAQRQSAGKRTSAVTVPAERIERAILLLRRQKIMLDADLAALYDVETRVLDHTMIIIRSLAILLLLRLAMPLSSAATTTFGSATVLDEVRQQLGVIMTPSIYSGCAPAVPSSSLTIDAFACTALVQDSSTPPKLVPVVQPAIPLVVPNSATGYLAIVSTEGGAAPAGWTRESNKRTHYVYQAASAPPANPTGGLVFAKVTVAGGMITAVDLLGNRAPVLPQGQHVLWSTARADGSTDNTATLQADITRAATLPGHPPIQLPSGTIRLSDRVTLANNTQLLCAGMGRTVLQLAPSPDITSNNTVLWLGTTSGGRIADCTIDINKPNVTGLTAISGIGGNFSDWTIENVEIKNTIGGSPGGTGIHCNPPCDRNKFRFNYIHKIGHIDEATVVHTDTSVTATEGGNTLTGFSGLSMNAYADHFVEVSGAGILSTVYRVYSNDATSLHLSGQFWDQATGSDFTARIATEVDIGDGLFVKGCDNVIVGNIIRRVGDGNTVAGSNTAVETTPCSNVVVGNIIEHTYSNGGFTLGPGNVGVVANNVIRNTAQQGLYIESLGSVAYTPPTIVNNEITGTGLECIFSNYFGTTITGNTLKRCGRHGIMSGGNSLFVKDNTILEPGNNGILLDGGVAVLTQANASLNQGGSALSGFSGLTPNQYAGHWVVVSGEAHVIIANTPTTLTIPGTWALSTGSSYTANIYLGSAGSSIVGNTIRNPGLAAAEAAIRLLNSAFNIRIGDNHMYRSSAAAQGTLAIDNDASPCADVFVGPGNVPSGLVMGTISCPSVMLYQGTPYSIRARHDAAQEIPHATDTAVVFNIEDYKRGTGIHSTSSNPSRFIVVLPGLYTMKATGSFEAHNTGLRWGWLRIDGSTKIREDKREAIRGQTVTVSVEAEYAFAAGQYVEFVVHHTAGTGIDIVSSGQLSPVFTMSRIGD